MATMNLNTQKKRTLFMKKAGPYLLILPIFVYYLLFWLRPVWIVVRDSFIDLSGKVSFQNYVMIFQSEEFKPALLNTAIIAGVSVTVEFVLALLIALLINQRFKGSDLFLFLCMIPMAMPAVAAGAMWNTGLTPHGWLNSLLMNVGILAWGDKIAWTTGEQFQKMVLIILVDAWQVIPSIMIILLAGLQGLPEEAKEAGRVFGGNGWDVLTKITLPMLKSTITTAVILRLISAIQIWLIIVMLFNFGNLPVLLERVVYYSNEVPGIVGADQMAYAYTVIITLVVSSVAMIYLKVVGAFETKDR